MAFFITLKGVRSSGKTTQAGRLADWRKKRGCNDLQTREPGGCQIASQIRAISLSTKQVQQRLQQVLMDSPPELDRAGS